MRISKQSCGNDTGVTAGLPSGMPSGTAGIKQIDSGGTHGPSGDARSQSDEAILPPTLSSPAVQGGRGPGASGVFPVELGTFKHSASSSNSGAQYKQAVRRAKAKMLIEAIGDAGPAYRHDPASALEALPSGMAQMRPACRPDEGEAYDGSTSLTERQPTVSPGPPAASRSVARELLPCSAATVVSDEEAPLSQTGQDRDVHICK